VSQWLTPNFSCDMKFKDIHRMVKALVTIITKMFMWADQLYSLGNGWADNRGASHLRSRTWERAAGPGGYQSPGTKRKRTRLA